MQTEKGKIGALGETFAEGYFLKKGFSVVRNFHSRYGEIDLIAENDEIIAFVEVKTRKAGSLTAPAEAVDFNKQRKIIQTARVYLQKNPSEKQPRFDVFEVYQNNGRVYKFNHMEAAFDIDGYNGFI